MLRGLHDVASVLRGGELLPAGGAHLAARRRSTVEQPRVPAGSSMGVPGWTCASRPWDAPRLVWLWRRTPERRALAGPRSCTRLHGRVGAGTLTTRDDGGRLRACNRPQPARLREGQCGCGSSARSGVRRSRLPGSVGGRRDEGSGHPRRERRRRDSGHDYSGQPASGLRGRDPAVAALTPLLREYLRAQSLGSLADRFASSMPTSPLSTARAAREAIA